MDLKLYSWNVNGIRANLKRGSFNNFLSSEDPDIICLQELSPNQAMELNTYLSDEGYKSIFLSQTPSAVSTGAIVYGEQVSEWCGKFIGTPLVGTFISKLYKFIDVGRFWLNETPESIPQNTDRGETDKGFGNINTYRAVLWTKIQLENNDILFVFNSHYPLSSNNKTRLECAKLERSKIKEITQGNNWVSAGDRNIIPSEDDNGSYNPAVVYQELVKDCHDIRDATTHYGINTTLLGFSYDKHKNPIKSGKFKNNSILDIIVSNLVPNCSFYHPGAFNPITKELIALTNGLDEQQNEERYFASDHALIGADFYGNQYECYH